MGPRIGRARFDVSLSGDGSKGGSGSQSWTRSVDDGKSTKRTEIEAPTDLLQLEGPMQDTASSPVKEVGQKPKPRGVVIA